MAEKQTNKDRMREIVDNIETGIKELFESDKYRQYLSTMSRFHRYSVNNTMLIYMQRPNATHVAGFNKWRDQFGRNVMKGEKGIKIIAPTPYKKKVEEVKLDPDTKAPMFDKDGNAIMEEKEIKIPMYKVVSVFDVSQTEGKPLPQLASDLSGNVQQYEVFMEALRRSSPVPMEIKPIERDTDGYFSSANQSITIQAGMSEVQTVCAAVHEIAHAKLHNYEKEREAAAAGDETAEPVKPKDRRTEEVEAESISYAVCQYYGIETADNSFGYIATWSQGKELKELRASLETINKTASGLITDIDRHFAEICKERGISLEQEADQPALPQEILYKLDDKYLHIFQTQEVFSYTIYNAENSKELGGGWIEAPDAKSMREVCEAICVQRDLDTRSVELAPLSVIQTLLKDREQTVSEPDTPDRFAVDYCGYLEQLYQQGVIEKPFSSMTADEIAPEIADMMRHGHFSGLREVLEDAAKRDPEPGVAASMLRRVADLNDQWDASLTYQAEPYPFSSGEHDHSYIQAFEQTVTELSPREIIFVGPDALCRELTEKLNAGEITAREVRAMAQRREAELEQMRETAMQPGYEQWSEPSNAENAPEYPDTPSDDVASYLPEPPLGGGDIVDATIAPYDPNAMAPELEQGYPMPDPALTMDDMHNYGYLDNDMLPLTKERAVELMEQDLTVYMLYSANGAGMAFDMEDIDSHDGMFAIAREEWDDVRDNLAPSASYEVSYAQDEQARQRMRTQIEYVAAWEVKNDIPPADRLTYWFGDLGLDVAKHGVSDAQITEKYNHLKAAEMSMEDDYGMIDGVINNGKAPSVADLEAQVKAGQQISLLDLANAVKRERQEKKPSVLEQLRNQPIQERTHKTAPKKSAEREI